MCKGLRDSILELKENSFPELRTSPASDLVAEKKNFLEQIERIHDLGLLKIVQEQKLEANNSHTQPFISGEIKLNHLIDPSYSSKIQNRSKLYFMIMNDESISKSEPKTELRIFSDEPNPENPFYHLNIEFPPNKVSNKIKNLFKGTIDTQPYLAHNSALNKEHENISKLLEAENKVIDYLSLRHLGKTASSIDDLNLLKSLNQIINISKSSLISRCNEIKSGESFTSTTFYAGKLYNTSGENLLLKQGYINTDAVRVQFLRLSIQLIMHYH